MPVSTKRRVTPRQTVNTASAPPPPLQEKCPDCGGYHNSEMDINQVLRPVIERAEAAVKRWASDLTKLKQETLRDPSRSLVNETREYFRFVDREDLECASLYGLINAMSKLEKMERGGIDGAEALLKILGMVR